MQAGFTRSGFEGSCHGRGEGALRGGLGSLWGTLLGSLVYRMALAFGILIFPRFSILAAFILMAAQVITATKGLVGPDQLVEHVVGVAPGEARHLPGHAHEVAVGVTALPRQAMTPP